MVSFTPEQCKPAGVPCRVAARDVDTLDKDNTMWLKLHRGNVRYNDT